MQNVLIVAIAAALLSQANTNLDAQTPSAANPLATEVDRLATELNPQVVA